MTGWGSAAVREKCKVEGAGVFLSAFVFEGVCGEMGFDGS